MTTEERDIFADTSKDDISPSEKHIEKPTPFRSSRMSSGGGFRPTPRVGAKSKPEPTDQLQQRKRRVRIGEQQSSRPQSYRRDDFSGGEGNNRSEAPSYNNRYGQDGQRTTYPASYRQNEERGQRRDRHFEKEYDANRAMDSERMRGSGSSYPRQFRDTERSMYSGGNRTLTLPQQKKKKKQPKAPIVPVKYREVLADPNEPIRLNKFLSNAGVCSRREADLLIEKGEITVNGEVVTELGRRITRQDEVIYKDKRVEIESKVYVLLNKPKNCVTTSDDPECRTTVMDIVRYACPERIYPVGRLDRNTTGVLLITNDGDLASKLTHPSFKKKKIYHVWLNKDVSIEDMQKIADGVELDDGEIHADAISYVKEDDLSQVGIEIHSGRNRIVRRLFEHLGYRVVKLDRVYFAGLTKKNLPRGKWRYLNEQEVNNLRMGAFE
ncbi:pseudouridine synthase [Porphyromonas gulae]|uniref:pseudouridine synthase n=1 Tax=Porphyromonas gulae TaxID=111105 RepID=UPI00052DDD99|nr:pseudouridine synthase [Porphyromonas gulae]KGN68811.1 pseudouridine synthase [Porphyromonas gulae]